MMYSYIDSTGVNASFVNNGDDGVLFCEFEDVHKLILGLQPWFSQIGFVMEVEPTVDVFERVEFCQMRPVFDGVYWRMVRDPRVAMTKDVTFLHPRECNDVHLSQVGTCGMALASGMPIIQEHYWRMCKGVFTTVTSEVLLGTGFYSLSNGLESRYTEVTPEARLSFYLAFGILPDLQEAIEDQIRVTDWKWSEESPGPVPGILLG
jgi:hypothetical protein